MTVTTWGIIASVLAIIEMFTSGFLVIWFAIGAAITTIALAFFPDLTLTIQLIIFISCSAGLFLLTKNKIKKKFDKSNSQPVYSILGKTAIVTKEINSIKGIGQISINGDIWSAKNTNGEIIPIDSKVEILDIDGVKAIVKAIEPTSESKSN